MMIGAHSPLAGVWRGRMLVILGPVSQRRRTDEGVAMSESNEYAETEADRVHGQEPAEGAEQPGEVEPAAPHADAPAEGDDN